MRKINIYHSVQDAPEVLPRNTVICGDYLAVLRKIPDGSIDAVIIDPPYTDGKTDALPNHKIQTKVDIDLVFIEANRVLKADGFICFFGIMPTVLAWLNAAAARFKFREHITWSKRAVTSPYLDIQRTKEELFIYAKGKPKYHETMERYEDLKVPALHLGYYELSSIKMCISDLHKRNNNAAYNMRYYPNISSQNNPSPETKNEADILDNTANNDVWRGAKLDKAVRKGQDAKRLFDEQTRSGQKQQHYKELRGESLYNDDFYQQKYPTKIPANPESDFEKIVKNACRGGQAGYQDASCNDATYSKERNVKGSFRYSSKQWCNILNLWAFIFDEKEWYYIQPVWSYLSQNQTKFGKDGENWKHPTVKPVRCLERLIKLILPLPNEDYTPVVLDFFGGTGTTAIAADNLGIDFITAEIIDTYFEIIVERLDKNDQNSVERFGATSHNPEPPKPKFIQQNMFD